MTDGAAAQDFLGDALQLSSPTGVERPLVMKFGGSLVEQLGAQLYPSVTATVAELISNAWDADATSVWVQVPFDADWSEPSAEISVIDNGHGMTRAAAQATYLVVGRKKRLGPHGDRSENGRPVHGRKGIGKLAAFGTASYLECTTLRDDTTTAFGLDYDELRRLNPDQNYYVDPVKDPAPLVAPTGEILRSGTRIKLTGLRVKRKISEQSFLNSMSRRFALTGMEVWINGKPLQRYSIPLEYRLPADYNPDELPIDADGWAKEKLPSGDIVSWWIGFTAKPLAESDQQGISILARDKMAQRPFKFERSQGTTAQLGLEYLVGEVKADWIDNGDDIDTDYIQSNRDQLQLEDSRLDEFLQWGRRRLSWALRARQELRNRQNEATVEKDALVAAVLGSVDAHERRALTSVARKLAKIPEVDARQLADVMQAVVSIREDARMRELSENIAETDVQDASSFWLLVDRTMRVDAQRLSSVLDARISALTNLLSAARTGYSFEAIASRVQFNPWILDPSWTSYGPPTLEPVESALDLPPTMNYHHQAQPTSQDIAIIWCLTDSPADGAAVDLFRRHVAEVQARHVRDFVKALLVAPTIARGREELKFYGERSALHVTTWVEALTMSLAMHRSWHEVAINRSILEM